MRAVICLLLAAACVLADESRGSKRPYIADAVGNTLPPPSNGPATVGSPVNLLTPDRYEFYTFDESGELVKRLMTLQEIQAIVAAGEESEGLVTFANDNQPTIAFNFSQPPYTKVHNVVTNVQNVLKAQMEAHKNNPQTNPTLDTPDVSDSWSLILPSIFGNTGVDIIPDKTSGTFSTPETETFEFDRINFDENLSKEGSNPISSSTAVQKESEKASVTVKMSSTTELIREVTTTAKPTPKSTTTSTTPKPTTTTSTTPKPTTTTTTTTLKPTTTSTSTTTTSTTTTTTTEAPSTTTTTPKPTTTTTSKPRTTPTTRRPPTSTTSKPRTTASTTKLTITAKPTVKVTAKPATTRPLSTTRRQISSTTPKTTEKQTTKIQVQSTSAGSSTTENSSPIYEKISSISPVSTAAYVTERSTRKPVQTTKFIASSESTTKNTFVSISKLPSTVAEKTHPTVTTYKPLSSTPFPLSSTFDNIDIDKENTTTVTTQSVSPSTTVSSTEFMSVSQPSRIDSENKPVEVNEPNIMFDVAQSISQIASDLGSTNYQPIPTTNDLLEATNAMNMDIESKDSLEFDIPSDLKTEPVNKTTPVKKDGHDNFIKISTINPHPFNDKNKPSTDIGTSDKLNEPTIETTVVPEIFAITSTGTPIDPILSESMDDLISQVVNQAPQSIVGNEKNVKDSNEIPTTEKTEETSATINTEDLKANSKNSANNSTVKTEQVPLNEITLTDNITKSNDNELPQKPITQEKPEFKNPENNNFVQISTPLQNDVSVPESNDIPIKPIQLENRTETSQIISSDKQNNDIAVINAHKEPPNKSIVSTEAAPHQQILHKVQVEQINQLSENVSNDNKDKEILSLPKVDEFKKKIQKVNIDYKEIANERNNSWKLISTVSPPKANEIPKDKTKTDNHNQENPNKDIVLDFSKENQGLEVTTKDLGEDIAQFTELCNELAFRYWTAVVENIPNKRSFVLSPFSITSMLAMMFMGAKGATSGEMNEILKLDDMVTFNPHFTLKNISDSIETNPSSGVAVSAFIRELYSDRNKGKILTFYKERAQHFYNGHVEEINFKLISDIIRRRTNLLVKRYTWGRIIEYMKANTITMQPPLAAFSTNIFETDCTGSSVEGRDGEMYFVVSPNVRQRRLVPVPAVLYKKGFLAGYDPVLDATAAALGNTNSIISTLFLMPGQQGNVVHAEDLEALEKRLLESNPSTPAWNRLLRTLLPRIGLELQIPRFSHKSIFNISSTLKKMGLKDLFDANHADLGGLNGPSKDLYLSDMIQSTTFVTCGEGVIGEQHHIEEYPESLELARRRRTSRWTTGWDEPRDYQRAFHDPHDVGDAMNLPLHLRPRQARLPARDAQPARLKFDRPFLYFVRHNPSGMILYVGRYNPRLLP